MALASPTPSLRSIAPFAGAALLAFVLVPIGTTVDWSLYGAALALTIAVLLGSARLRWPRMLPVGGLVSPVVFLGAVALLRQAAGGSAAGVGMLVLLPVFWLALHGDRRQLVALVATSVLYWVLPVLLIGAPNYPSYTLRSGALSVVISGIVGLTVQGLVAAARAREEDLRALGAERERLTRRLEDLATTDPLTGAGNRRAWDAWTAEAMRAAARTCEPLCVAMLDLDRFKAYNDTLGHLRGDHLLRAAAVAWEQELRPGDRLARYGGEEFLVLLSGCGVEDAVAAVERLRAVTPEGQTCSAGLARWDGRESAAALFERVDAALYSAKATGRDRTVTAVPASPAATSSPSALKKRALGPA